MGRMSPAAYDHWWRARIVKEEADHANHILRNWQLQSSRESSNPITPLITLNSLGAPQIIAPAPNFIQQQIAAKSVAAGASGVLLLGRSSSVDKPPRGPGSPAASRPATAAASASAAAADDGSSKKSSRVGSLSAVHRSAASASGNDKVVDAAAAAAAATKQAGSDDDDDDRISLASGISSSTVSKSRRRQAGPASQSVVRSVAKGSHPARSNVSYPQTPNFSQVGSSVVRSEVMSRLARLEADLAAEKKKREAAEAEMRQLLASRGPAKPGVS